MPPPPPGAAPPPFLSDQSAASYIYLTLVTVFIYVGLTCCCLGLRRLRQNIPIDDVEAQRNHPQHPHPPPNYNPNQTTAAQPPLPPEKKEASLFPYTKTQAIATNTGSDSECSICLDKFKDGDICRLLIECKHAFHGDCIDQWLLKEKRIHCPLCRATLSSAN